MMSTRASSPGRVRRSEVVPATARSRWWRWRGGPRAEAQRTLPQQEADIATSSFYLRLDQFCQQVASYLPSVSASTRKAIFCCVALLVAWKVILWALELVVTTVCFSVALLIVVCFLRPDLALTLLTEVLPPYLEAARAWLSSTFLSAGLSLTRRRVIVPTPAPAALTVEDLPVEDFALEEAPIVTPPPPTTPAPRRSPRTVTIRPHRAESEPAMIESTA